MRSLFSLVAKPSRRRGVRRREVFSAQFDGGQSAATLCTNIHLGCDVLERRIVLTSSEGDFVFSQGTITGYKGAGGVVDIPSTIGGKPVVVIGDNAFKDNAAITSVAIPNSVVIVGDFAFSFMESLTTVRIGNGVTYIGESAFAENDAVTKLTIGKSVQTIGDYAFRLVHPRSVTIPDSVKTIGSGAFEGCGITSLNIGKSVQTIGYAAFMGNDLRSVSIPDSVKTIGGHAFYSNGFLKTVTIGDGVKTIGDEAFSGNATTSLHIGKGVKTIGKSAFSSLPLESVTIPNSVTTIGEGAFAGPGLKRVTIGDHVTSIGDNAFLDTSLRTVAIPNSVKSIGAAAFANIASLKTVTIANAKTSIGNFAFVHCGKLTSVSLGSGVTSIGSSAFFESGLKSLTIPDSVKTIGGTAFASCSNLATVSIGKGVSTIGEWAFRDAAALKSVKFTAKAPTVGTDAFKGVPFGAKAIRDAGLTGYGQNGDIWNGLIVWTPGRVAAPTVSVNTASLAQNLDTFTIKGTGFLAGKPSLHQVTFNHGAVGTVTAATSTTLTVKFTKQATSTGPLTAIVTNIGGSSGVAKQVATVVSADNSEVPFPDLPTGAGAIDSDAPKSFAITSSGLQYRVLRQGSGAKPSATGTVTVNYQGWLNGGKVFDSSYPNSAGLTFNLTQVIAGFAEGVQLVGKGGMIELVMPSDLAYGSAGSGSAIPPNSTTYWLVEIIDVR